MLPILVVVVFSFTLLAKVEAFSLRQYYSLCILSLIFWMSYLLPKSVSYLLSMAVIKQTHDQKQLGEEKGSFLLPFLHHQRKSGKN